MRPLRSVPSAASNPRLRRVLPLLLCLSPVVAMAQAPSGTTLWLVQPLYPGQEPLVARTETAIADIIPKEQRGAELIGRKELEAHLAGKSASLGCLTGETSGSGAACGDPIDGLVGGLGLTRVVLIRGGQDESGYRYRVTSYEPATGKRASADGVNARLDRALLGALVKVVPLASTMEVASKPTGATVFIDGEKVGRTPLQTQVLPGERVIKLELESHLPAELTQLVPVRGAVKVERSLEKVPARLVVIAKPEGTEIAIDGTPAGKDRVDQGIQPGSHTVALSLKGYQPLQETLEIKPGDTATVDRTLLPTTGTRFKNALRRAQEDIYERRNYFQLAYENSEFNADRFRTTIYEEGPNVDAFVGGSKPALSGVSIEYGSLGRYFGLSVIGAAYLTTGGDTARVQLRDGSEADGRIHTFSLRALQPQLRIAFWRFTLGLQAGLEVRYTQFLLYGETDLFWADAPRQVDLDLAAQATLRAYVFDGFYLTGAFRASRAVSQNAGYYTLQGGLGYAF